MDETYRISHNEKDKYWEKSLRWAISKHSKGRGVIAVWSDGCGRVTRDP